MSQKTLLKPIIIEAYSKIDEQAHITGVALIPRISRNNNLYTKAELQRFDNVQVPLNWEHDPSKNIGLVTFHYNSELETVYYDGMITDEAAADLARNKTLFTSIEADPTDMKEVCNGPNDCFHMPFGLIPVGLSLTETPGVPETSVIVIENYLRECASDKELEIHYSPYLNKRVDDQDFHIHKAEKQDDCKGTIDVLTNKCIPEQNDDCVQKQISKLADEEPDMPQDQRIAIAFSKCGLTKSHEMISWLVKEFVRFKESIYCSDCGELKKN